MFVFTETSAAESIGEHVTAQSVNSILFRPCITAEML